MAWLKVATAMPMVRSPGLRPGSTSSTITTGARPDPAMAVSPRRKGGRAWKPWSAGSVRSRD